MNGTSDPRDAALARELAGARSLVRQSLRGDRDAADEALGFARLLRRARRAAIIRASTVVSIAVGAGGVGGWMVSQRPERTPASAAAKGPAREARALQPLAPAPPTGAPARAFGPRCEIDYVDPAQADIGATERSHWLQPWRASVETWPAARMAAAAGVIVGRQPGEDETMVRLLARSRVARVVLDLGWPIMRFDDPTQILPHVRPAIVRHVAALGAAGKRPVLLLFGIQSFPAPKRAVSLRVVADAPAGARELRVDPRDVGELVAGRSGLDTGGFRNPAAILFTGIAPDGRLALSRPLDQPLSRGVHRGTVLRFAPFQAVTREDGAPNPVFEETMRGWLDYVAAMATVAREALGHDGFDIELWQQRSSFHNASAYYELERDPGPGSAENAVSEAVVARTARWLRDPANGFAGVRVYDTFSHANGAWPAAEIPGVDAVGRRITVRGARFPGADERCPSLRADGAPNGTRGADGAWSEAFTPTYRALFPELPLTPILCGGRLFQDLAARRQTRGFADPLPLAITSFRVDPAHFAEAAKTGGFADTDRWHLQTKWALRALSAFVGEGAPTVDLWNALDRGQGLVDRGAPDGGAVLRALDAFLAPFGEAITADDGRRLVLERVGSCAQRVQFAGDGTAAHPPLHDAEVVAFFPFRAAPRRFLAPVYVMSRSLLTPYRAGSPGDVARFDLPDQTFTLTLSGADAAGASVRLEDPITLRSSALPFSRGAAGQIVVDVPLTDYPRLLVVDHR